MCERVCNNSMMLRNREGGGILSRQRHPHSSSNCVFPSLTKWLIVRKVFMVLKASVPKRVIITTCAFIGNANGIARFPIPIALSTSFRPFSLSSWRPEIEHAAPTPAQGTV